MLRLLADENLDGNIVRGLVRKHPGVDIVRVQDVGLRGADDPAVLAWAASEGRVVVTHDVATMTTFAFERVGSGLPMPGLIEIVLGTSIGQAIDELAFVTEYYFDGDLECTVLYLPL